MIYVKKPQIRFPDAPGNVNLTAQRQSWTSLVRYGALRICLEAFNPVAPVVLRGKQGLVGAFEQRFDAQGMEIVSTQHILCPFLLSQSGSVSESVSEQEELRTHPSVFDPDPDPDSDPGNGITLC